MPPKRATRGATAMEEKATRATRSRVTKETPPAESESNEQTSTRSTRTRKSTAASDDVQEKSTPKAMEAQPEDAPAPPRTVQRPLTRGRPPRTLKKPAPSQANKKTMDAMKKRMEDERRANEAGVVPEQQSESRAERAEKAVREAENNEEDKALAPAFPRSPSPTRQAVPGTAVKAPATVTRPQSALKVQSTPGAETSVLALQNFRRRPRQPSLLQMVQNPDLDLGNDTTDFTLGMSDDEDDFAPHDEGTPLQTAKARPREEKEPEIERAQTPPPAEAEDDDDDDLYGATPKRPRQSRKRKSDTLEDDTEVQVIRSSPSLPHSPLRSATPSGLEIIPATAPSSTSEEAATTESQQRKLLSDTFADPLSSPPASPLSPTSPPARTLPPRTISPTALRKSTRTGTTTTKSSKQKPLTTATLRALLPKRRRRNGVTIPKDDFDISSSSQDPNSSAFEDDKRRRGAVKSKAKPKVVPVAKKGTSPVVTKKRLVSVTEKGKKTYGRRVDDKENTPQAIDISSASASSSSSLSELESVEEGAEETVDTSVSTVTGGGKGVGGEKGTEAITDELKKARMKFADVDLWEMEFESASLGAGGDSSPWR